MLNLIRFAPSYAYEGRYLNPVQNELPWSVAATVPAIYFFHVHIGEIPDTLAKRKSYWRIASLHPKIRTYTPTRWCYNFLHLLIT